MPDIKLKDMTERELLIQQARDIKLLCKSFDDFQSDNKDEHTEIKGKVEKVTDNKVSNWLFFPIITLIVIMIIGLTAYTGNIKNDVVKNTTAREMDHLK